MGTLLERYDVLDDAAVASQVTVVNLDSERTDDLQSLSKRHSDTVDVVGASVIQSPNIQQKNRGYLSSATGFESTLVDIIKQKWSGKVLRVEHEDVHVQLEDLTNPENVSEYAVFSIDEIDVGQRKLVRPGAMLYWHIGYREGSKTPRERFSKIQLRRLPKWNSAEIASARETAHHYAHLFASNIADNSKDR